MHLREMSSIPDQRHTGHTPLRQRFRRQTIERPNIEFAIAVRDEVRVNRRPIRKVLSQQHLSQLRRVADESCILVSPRFGQSEPGEGVVRAVAEAHGGYYVSTAHAHVVSRADEGFSDGVEGTGGRDGAGEVVSTGVFGYGGCDLLWR